MKLLTWKILFFVLQSQVFGKMFVILDERIEKCVKPDEDAGVYDFSSMKLIAEDDTTVFVNGSVKFLRDIKAPWHVHLFTERFTKGSWNVLAFVRDMKDFCAHIHSKSELWYNSMIVHQGCPLSAGVRSVIACKKLKITKLRIPFSVGVEV